MNDGKGNNMVLDRTGIHGNNSVRYGVLRMVDVFSLRGGVMGDIAFVLIILILALWLWRPRKE